MWVCGSSCTANQRQAQRSTVDAWGRSMGQGSKSRDKIKITGARPLQRPSVSTMVDYLNAVAPLPKV